MIAFIIVLGIFIFLILTYSLAEYDSPIYFFGMICIVGLTIITSEYIKEYEELKEKFPKEQILQQFTDTRGLTSVVFIQIDTVGLDYLTKQELDSLKTTFR